MEKCSESIGINFVLNFFSLVFINFQPQIIDSLFALARFFVKGIIFNVGSNPSNPEIPTIVKSIFFLFFFRYSEILGNKFIFFFSENS